LGRGIVYKKKFYKEKKVKKIFIPLLCLMVTFIILPCAPVLADSGGLVGGGVSIDAGDVECDDYDHFINTIDGYSGWSICSGFNAHDIHSGWWEEVNLDYNHADLTELCFLSAHGHIDNNNNTYADCGNIYYYGYLFASEVNLGYESDDEDPQNIWCITIVCGLLRDDYSAYSDWVNVLNGCHMFMGFESDAVAVFNAYTGDYWELADRMETGGTYSRQQMANAFYDTFVSTDDQAHYANIVRILAEDDDCAAYDYQDSYTSEYTVDATKYIYTYGPAV
jgi:hypothetical protein